MKTIDGENRRLVRRQVADHVKGLIRAQHLCAGARLPSYDEICGATGASLVTVKRGMDLLEEEGVVRCIHGKGSFVNRELSRQGRPLKTLGIVHTATHTTLLTQSYAQEIIQGLTEGQTHLDVLIFSMRLEGFVSAAQLAEKQVDGVILLGLESDAFVQEFATWGVPGVVVDQVPEGVPLDCVACDNAAGARRAVQRLVELGHRHIRYLGREPRRIAQFGTGRTLLLRSSDHAERHEAAVAALSAVPGLRWDADLLIDADREAGLFREWVNAWQRATDRPTAILTGDTGVAGQVIQELAGRGLAVPRDVSICAVAADGGDTTGGVALTGSRFDFKGMGRKAAELLRQRCESPAKAPSPKVHRIGFEWVEGGTCGECRVSGVA